MLSNIIEAICIGILVGILGYCLLSGDLGPLIHPKDDLTVSFDDAMKSTAVVQIGDTHGTGVLVSPTILITAKHVIYDENETGIAVKDDIDSIRVRFKDGNIRHVVRADDLPHDDLSVLTLDEPVNGLLYPKIQCTPVKVRDQLTMIGNPLTDEFLTSRLYVMGVNSADGEIHSPIMVEGPLVPGYSGSGIFNDQNEIVGIADAMATFVPNPTVPTFTAVGIGVAMSMSYFCNDEDFKKLVMEKI